VAEFALIDRLARAIPVRGAGVQRSIGDDAAVLLPDAGRELLVATDTLNEGVHFLPGADPASLGYKALAVNLSDLAAMGARARWALLALSMPAADERWIDGFAAGFAELARRCGVSLVGGDTCSGSLSVTVTVLGDVPAGQSLCRDGAAAGDLVYVSGSLGDAALALRRRLAGQPCPVELERALDRPEPQLALGRRLRGLATACIDLSDGLLADLGHLARASGLGAAIELGRLPASPPLASLPPEDRWTLQLSGGEDYGLCFTLPESACGALDEIARDLGIRLTRAGRLQAGDGVACLTPDQDEWVPASPGWEHFSAQPETDADG
jgi:thiamine-monophosphate kinase